MSGGSKGPVDVLVLTCLLDELEAVLALGDGGKASWTQREDPGGLPYHVRSFHRPSGRSLHLAVAWSTSMGEVAAADRARALAQHLSPRWLAMCGICAGRRGEVCLGDVIVADRVFSYDHGKLIASTGPDGQRQEEIFRDITTYNLRDPWFTRAAYFARDLSWSAELAASRPVSLEQQSRWLLHTLLLGEDPALHPDRRTECPDWARALRYLENRGLVAYPQPAVVLTDQGRGVAQRERIESPDGPRRDPVFRVHMGPIATGKTVRSDPEIFDRIKQFSRKAIGIEMEAAAIGYVAERLGVPSLIAKAVSDFADHDKDDGFRLFACQASARFVLAFFLGQDLEDEASSGRTFYAAPPRPDGVEPETEAEPTAPAVRLTTLPGITMPDPATTMRSIVHGPASPSNPTVIEAAPPDSERDIATGLYHPTLATEPRTDFSVAAPPAPPPSAGMPLPLGALITTGTVLGQWRLLEMIGRGGMGTVYKAEHVAIGRTAAVKVLRTELTTNPEIAQRFLNEARAAARIQHIGVVDIYDHAIHGTGAAYIVMELLDGVGLDELIRRASPLSESEAGSIAAAIADALAAAHRLGIVHRDLKPSNVCLVSDRNAPFGRRVKVLDFGIAKLSSNELEHHTVTGTVMGTPSYMSPEQLRGAHDTDARTDQYSLGCLLFEMVSGRKPFEARNLHAMVYAQVTQARPRLGSLAPVSSALERIVARLLAIDPADRFPDMEDVGRALSAISGATLIIPPPGLAPPSGLPPRSGLPSAPPRRVPQSTARPAGAGDGVGRGDDDALRVVLPDHLQGEAPLIRRFLLHVAGSYEKIGDSTLRLIDPRVPGAAGFEFFALLLSGASGGGGRELGTMTFVHHALPLEDHLAGLDRDARKVVIALSDSFELGRGVREKILDYRNRLDALVVPIYLGELRKADRAGRLDALFMDRIDDFQALPDLYAASGPLSDPTRFFGMRQVLDELIAELEDPTRIVVIHGLPGSGKSSLVRMADYGMSAARFVRVACGGVAPAALPAKIAAALGGSGERAEDLLRVAGDAQRAATGSRLVLVLEDADACLPGPIEPVWESLIALARTRVISTVATSVRGFTLGQRVRDGRPNPLAQDVRSIEVPRLDRETAARLVRDLGAQMNVTAADRVVAECVELSGGNVDVLRRLCSGMLKRHRRDTAHHALRAVELIRRDLRDTAADLIAMRSTFESLLPWLSPAEKRVVRGIAEHPPQHAAQLGTAELSSTDASAAIEDLRAMGLVERIDARERLTIPLLAAWAKHHLPGGAGWRWLTWMR